MIPMIINRQTLKNPYIRAYADINGIADGGEIFAVQYMIWFDKKQNDFRNTRKLPENAELNTDQQREFMDFLWLK